MRRRKFRVRIINFENLNFCEDCKYLTINGHFQHRIRPHPRERWRLGRFGLALHLSRPEADSRRDPEGSLEPVRSQLLHPLRLRELRGRSLQQNDGRTGGADE